MPGNLAGVKAGDFVAPKVPQIPALALALALTLNLTLALALTLTLTLTRW